MHLVRVFDTNAPPNGLRGDEKDSSVRTLLCSNVVLFVCCALFCVALYGYVTKGHVMLIDDDFGGLLSPNSFWGRCRSNSNSLIR